MIHLIAKEDCFTTVTACYLQQECLEPVATLAREEKVVSQALVDALDGLAPNPAVVRPFITEPYCLASYPQRTTLSASGANLIVIGLFADMLIRPYRHREQGWRFFELKERIRFGDAFDAVFEREEPIRPSAPSTTRCASSSTTESGAPAPGSSG